MRVTVVGAGIVGLATALALQEAGAAVRCVEADVPMGARSRGGSRIFRLAHADPRLVADAARARHVWDAWSARAGRTLVGGGGTVVSGPRVPAWAAAMAAAEVPHEVRDDAADLPGPVDGPVLRDPGGGVLDMAATGAFLRGALGAAVVPGRVVAVETDGTVVTDAGRERADAVVVAAGAGTPALAGPLGVEVPAELEHHVRFAFPLRHDRSPACHLDGTPRGPLTSTYQHRTREGLWAVGGHLPDDDTAWSLGVEEVTRRSREVVVAHVAEHLPDVVAEPVEALACSPTRGLGDGVRTARAGVVHVVWGENLAKLAPVLGERLAAAVAGDTPVPGGRRGHGP